VNEIDTLARLRQDMPPISAHARAQGRLRLLSAMDEHALPARPGLPARRILLFGAAVLILTIILVGYQIVGPPGAGTTAEAATVLHKAAAAAVTAPVPAPRADQFTYIDVLHVTSGERQRTQTWTSVDGSRPGLTRSAGFLGSSSDVVPPYDPAGGLYAAPYTVLAKLPTDPAALLKVLGTDPYVENEVRSNKVTRDVGIWSLIRELVETAPPPQKAALFQAASRIKGIRYVAGAIDAAGRTGEAVGLDDPRLGNIQFIFDRKTHEFLGERILTVGSTTQVQFNDALQQTGLADTPGVVPSR